MGYELRSKLAGVASRARRRQKDCKGRGPNNTHLALVERVYVSISYKNRQQRCFGTTPNRCESLCEFGVNLSTTQHNEKGMKKRHTVAIPLCGVVLSGGAGGN